MADEQTAAAAPKKEKSPSQVVTMQDGRAVEFVGKRRMLKDILVDGSKVSVRIDFVNGETRTYPVPDQHLLYSAGHGWSQKLGDEVAGEKDPDDMVLAIDELADRLLKPGSDWNMAREGGGFSGTSILLRALVEHTGKPVDTLKAFLKGKSQAEKMALRNSSKLKPIVDRLEQEKASKTANVDTDALLSEAAALA